MSCILRPNYELLNKAMVMIGNRRRCREHTQIAESVLQPAGYVRIQSYIQPCRPPAAPEALSRTRHRNPHPFFLHVSASYSTLMTMKSSALGSTLAWTMETRPAGAASSGATGWWSGRRSTMSRGATNDDVSPPDIWWYLYCGRSAEKLWVGALHIDGCRYVSFNILLLSEYCVLWFRLWYTQQ